MILPIIKLKFAMIIVSFVAAVSYSGCPPGNDLECSSNFSGDPSPPFRQPEVISMEMLREIENGTDLPLPPDLLVQVFHGGQIPGVDQGILETIVRDYTSKMYGAALAAKNGPLPPDQARYLPPLEKLPKEIVVDVFKGESLPYLTEEQMLTVKMYYATELIDSLNNDNGTELPEEIVTPQLKSMVQLLPPGYDINKLSVEVIKTVADGKMPDLNALPGDLQAYVLNSGSNMNSPVSAKKTIDDAMRNVSRAPSTTFAPYDINNVGVELTPTENEADRRERVQIYSTLLTCAVGAISSIVLILLFIYMRQRYAAIASRRMEYGSFTSDDDGEYYRFSR